MSIDDVEAAFRKSYPRYQYYLVDFIAEHLTDLSRSFNGDMQMAVLLAIIGQSHLNAVIAAEAAGRGLDDILPERRGITTNRLADVTGIPRETARRKLRDMESRGWLQRSDGLWHLALQGNVAIAAHDLDGLDGRSIRRTARLFSLLLPLVQTEGQLTQDKSNPTKKPAKAGK
jgi:hypothetical protein